MNNTNSIISRPQQSGPVATEFSDDSFVTAEQASAALNLPLYYFIDTRKRSELGIPYYSISRMVRYRLRELHKWQVRYAAHNAKSFEQVVPMTAARAGGAHA